ncbi:ATP-binding protein [Candidatus Woesearchaeota archaeon]|nr:ATP-binding protein [Candidatus Woesearchaeota archaeon]
MKFSIDSLIQSKVFWYCSSTAIAAVLAVAPLACKWDKATTEAGFIGSAVTIGASVALAGEVERKATLVKVRNNIETRLEVSEAAHILNHVRASQAREIEMLLGQEGNGLDGMMAALKSVDAIPQMLAAAQAIGQLPASQTELIPTEDLAQTLATERSSGTLIVAPSGCGKTRLLQQAIVYANAHYKGDADFCILDNKGDESGWLGLENDRDTLIYDDESKTPEAYQWLQGLKQRLKAEKPSLPTIAVIDEWNNGLGTAAEHDEITEGQQYAKLMKIAAKGIVTKGRSKRVYGWMTTHTPKTDEIGMDSATRQSLNIIILARGNKLGLIASVLKGTYTFVDDDLIRQSLAQTFQEFMRNPDPNSPIALTNLSGQWRLVKLPPYPDEHPPLDRKAFNQSTAEILDEDSLEAIEEAVKTTNRNQLELLFNLDAELGAIDPSELNTEQLNKLIEEKRGENRGAIDQGVSKGESKFTALEAKVHSAAVDQESGVTARQIYQLGFAEFKGSSYADSIKAIQDVFLTLESKGVGYIVEDKNTQKYLAKCGAV